MDTILWKVFGANIILYEQHNKYLTTMLVITWKQLTTTTGLSIKVIF